MTLPRTCLAILLAAAVLGGCAVVPAHDYGYDPAPAVTVYAAPPVPLIEYRGLPPAFGYVWLDGYWNWGGGRYDWVPGRWVSPPPGRIWVPRVWRRDGERWHAHGGHWQPQRPQHRPPPQAVWPRRDFQPQSHQRPPEPLHRPGLRSERAPELPHRVERHPIRPGEPPRLSPLARQQAAASPAEAAPQRRAGDEGRHNGRRGPEDGEPHERRRPIP
jgi:hypothetical protein